MQTFNIIGTAAILIALTSCRGLCPTAELVVIHDTTTVEKSVTYRDTVFVAPASGATYTITMSDLVPGLKPILKTNKNAKLTAQVVNNRLVMGCYCDTVLIRARLKEVLIKEFRAKYKEVQKPPKEVRYIPGWVKFLAWTAVVRIALDIIYLVFKFYKP